jgi:glucosamine--fructose-6-phosphate aminotransferase (isomerizing)
VAVVGKQTAVVVLVPGGPFRASVLATAEALLGRTSRLITVGTGTVTGSCLHVPLDEVDPQALSLAFAVWLQRLTVDLATGLGFDPDAPHGLEKVTRTL